MSQEVYHFVTGRLAQHALRAVLEKVAPQANFQYSLQVMPITVAALMTPEWISRRLEIPAGTTKLFLPGYCEGDLTALQDVVSLPIVRGPKDLRQLPQYFEQPSSDSDYGSYDIQIIAEINHCPRLSLAEIQALAQEYAEAGADVIDVGCEPGHTWIGVTEAVQALRGEGHRVSVDSLNSAEIEAAVAAGAELVLSVNSSNREAALDWGVEVVAIPDDPKTLLGFDETIDYLAKHDVALRIDPILEPISFGFAESLGRYLDVRERYPDAEMMMGIGNLTELTDADSVGINTVLLGFCQELGIRSVLTTQVINWARSSVRECDLARRLVFHAISNQVLPKHIEPGLIMLTDEWKTEVTPKELSDLASEVRDSNYRIFVSEGEIHLINGDLHLHDSDPFALMDSLRSSGDGGSHPKNLDPSHAFYLGYEMCKAKTAMTLGKNYTQDEALNWGLATEAEPRHYLKRRPRKSDTRNSEK